jgi:hypothetical protein
VLGVLLTLPLRHGAIVTLATFNIALLSTILGQWDAECVEHTINTQFYSLFVSKSRTEV